MDIFHIQRLSELNYLIEKTRNFRIDAEFAQLFTVKLLKSGMKTFP